MIHHHGFLADYSQADSPIHRLPVGVKFFITIGLVIATVLIPMSHVLFFVSSAVAIILIAVISRVPPFFLIKRISMAEPIVLGAAILTLFQPNGGHIFVQIIVKSSLSICWTILLSNTTPFSELIDVMRRLRMPSLLVTTLALMYRYLFVLRDETSRMKRARASRTFNRDRAHAWKMIASIIGQLLVRTHERAERLYAAMCARGWQ